MNTKYYYTIGEVCNLLNLKPHIIRYWEKEFRQLRPRKTRGGNRKYTQEDIELIRRIQDMLHDQRYTIEGAKTRLTAERKAPAKIEPEINFSQTREETRQKIKTDLHKLKGLLKK
ncbi:MAG: MerR family transcriptional regulator [Candidatus Cloacimonetes bacterium]|nr:MerR family transcriptional regulator [Candidatus Cloacimonadota bacterium]